ncbi:MAG: hypothetical protein WDW36_000220 [Sanguina aurantia]
MFGFIRSRGRQNHRGLDAYTILLLFNLGQRIWELERKPPVTLLLVAVNFLVHFKGLLPYAAQDALPIPSISRGSLDPVRVIRDGQWGRLGWSAFLHLDDTHLYYNMCSLLVKGIQLEPRYGSVGFALLVAELLGLSHCLVAGGAYLLAGSMRDYRFLYHNTRMAGFSAVLFALKVVLTHRSPGWSSVHGISVPTKYLAWGELALISVLNPQASFYGHLCGILAGLMHAHLLAPLWVRAVCEEAKEPATKNLATAGLPAIVRSLPAWRRSRRFNSSGGRLGTARSSHQQAHPQHTNRNTPHSVATPSHAGPSGRAQAATGAGSSAANVAGTTALPRSLHTVGVPESFPMHSSRYNRSGGRLGGAGRPESASQSAMGRGVASDGSGQAGARLAGMGRDPMSLSGGGVAQAEVVQGGMSPEELRQRRLQRFGPHS